MFISIDQNSNSLWDVLPKIEALHTHQRELLHYVEDIDVAFTKVGSTYCAPQLTLEQYYPNGNLDWGASLFYMDFLGKVPLNLSNLSQYTGKKIATTAKSMGLTLQDLYKTFSVADNYQLTGTSYISSHPEKHRLLGDLSTDLKKPFIQQLLALAEADILERFIDAPSQERIKIWFKNERAILDQLWDKAADLATFYQAWIRAHLPSAQLELTSELFSEKQMAHLNFDLLKKIIKDYPLFQKIYNQSLEESGVELTPLRHGALPFFATYKVNGQQVRSGLQLLDGQIKIADQSFDSNISFDDFFNKVDILVGKALLLIITVRDYHIGHPLVLPELGSLYTPAAVKLAEKMQAHDFIDHLPHSIFRLQFNFIDQLKNSKSTISIPKHLQYRLGTQLTACELARQLPIAIAEAKDTLNQLKDPEKRVHYFSLWTPKLSLKIDLLKKTKEICGKDPDRRHECPQLWAEIKKHEQEKELTCFQRIIDLVQTTEMTYWNSRGALKPWSIAAGGESFYQQLLKSSKLREE